MMATDTYRVRACWLLSAFTICVVLTPGANASIPENRANHISRCNVTVTKETISTPLFTHPSNGLLQNYLKVYNVGSTENTKGKFCELPVEDVLSTSYEVYRGHYIAFVCSTTSPWFTNVKNIQTNHTVFVHFQNCNVSLINMGIFGQSVDLKTAALEMCSVVHDPSNATIDSGNDLVPIPGLENLVSLMMSSKKQEDMTTPDVLFTRKWPEMSEIELVGIQTTELQINALKHSMPNLQSLNLDHSARQFFVIDFPWAPLPKVLPQNLSRTSFFNNHYALSLGLDIEANRFRRIARFDNNGITNLSAFNFKGKLDMISFTNNKLVQLPEDIFNNVEGLFNLKLNNNSLIELPQRIFEKLSSLKYLDLSFNELKTLVPGIFNTLSQLKVLKLTKNHLQTILPGMFSLLPQLELLDLSMNTISLFANDAFDIEMHSLLREVNLDKNMLSHFPNWIFRIRNLQEVKLSWNPLSFNVLLRDLDDIDPTIVMFQNRESASSMDSPFKPLYHKTIHLRHNNFTSLNIENITAQKWATLQVIMNFFKLDLTGNPIICDCHTYKMYTFLKEERSKGEDLEYKQLRVLPSNYNSWQCTHPSAALHRPLIDVHNRTFMCQKDFAQCPDHCICLQRSFDDSIIVNCTARGLVRLPKYLPNGTDTLLLGANLLQTINYTSYFPRLTYLDLSSNKINTISAPVSRLMDRISIVDLSENKIERLPLEFQNYQSVNLMLSGNMFACDCHEKWMVRWIFHYRMKITDIDKVKCGSGIPRSDIIYQADIDQFVCELSRENIITISIVIIIVLSFIILAMILGYKFRGEIKVLVYFHFKWHPFDRTDVNDVVDKLYDAFVSYNKNDKDYVLNALKPAMENPENPYRLCMQDRDFKPGGGIQENVLYSVKYSRRMIMVLTKSYLDSEWCRLEFKSAHRRVLKDRSNYLIVILFDGLDVNDLDEEMKLYLKTNTYIKHDSRLFWKRLVYALPQKPLCLLRKEAFPEGGYGMLFPCPISVTIMQHVQNIHTLARDPNAQIIPVDVKVFAEVD